MIWVRKRSVPLTDRQICLSYCLVTPASHQPKTVALTAVPNLCGPRYIPLLPVLNPLVVEVMLPICTMNEVWALSSSRHLQSWIWTVIITCPTFGCRPTFFDLQAGTVARNIGNSRLAQNYPLKVVVVRRFPWFWWNLLNASSGSEYPSDEILPFTTLIISKLVEYCGFLDLALPVSERQRINGIHKRFNKKKKKLYQFGRVHSTILLLYTDCVFTDFVLAKCTCEEIEIILRITCSKATECPSIGWVFTSQPACKAQLSPQNSPLYEAISRGDEFPSTFSW